MVLGKALKCFLVLKKKQNTLLWFFMLKAELTEDLRSDQ